MPTAILPTSPRAINKQAMSTHAIPKTINFGAGGKALPDTYKYVNAIIRGADGRSTGNEAIDTMAFLHLLEQLKVRHEPRVELMIGPETFWVDPGGSESNRDCGMTELTMKVQQPES